MQLCPLGLGLNQENGKDGGKKQFKLWAGLGMFFYIGPKEISSPESSWSN